MNTKILILLALGFLIYSDCISQSKDPVDLKLVFKNEGAISAKKLEIDTFYFFDLRNDSIFYRTKIDSICFVIYDNIDALILKNLPSGEYRIKMVSKKYKIDDLWILLCSACKNIYQKSYNFQYNKNDKDNYNRSFTKVDIFPEYKLGQVILLQKFYERINKKEKKVIDKINSKFEIKLLITYLGKVAEIWFDKKDEISNKVKETIIKGFRGLDGWQPRNTGENEDSIYYISSSFFKQKSE